MPTPHTEDRDLLGLLHSLDDHVNYEVPLPFDRPQAEVRFLAVIAALQDALHVTLEVETGASIEDASFHSQAILPLEVSILPQHQSEIMCLRFSNFGNLIAIAGEDQIRPTILASIRHIISAHGYTFVPSHLLERKYSQPSAPGISSWWIRFFDYL